MKYLILLFVITSLFSCTETFTPYNDFKCDTSTIKNLEKVEDLKNQFSIELPKNWKINLYQDEVQSSIFAADTTKQLSKTVLIDINYINNKISFDEAFLLQQEQENLTKKLLQIKFKMFTFLDKSSVYMLYKGKKEQLNYQLYNTFIKVNETSFIQAKIEVYGDDFTNERLCTALSLLEKLQLNQ